MEAASLVRAFGAGDLTWLYLVAAVNLNIVPAAATEGLRGVRQWIAAALCFFLSGGKVLWAGTRKVKCRAATSLQMAAQSRQEFDDTRFAADRLRFAKRQENKPRLKAKALGFQLTPLENAG
jgi:hypothetical protein